MTVKINMSMEQKNWELFLLFYKRLCFDHVLECTDGNNNKQQAYDMLNSLDEMEKQIFEKINK